MPQRAWSAKRERQYEHIKEGLLESGRTEDKAEEIAARTVNKERARAGEARTASRTSIDDISSARRGGLRSHEGSGGRTYDQLRNEARDRGINEMSAALKRRFNFETVHPIADVREEMDLVQRETDKLLTRAGVPARLPEDLTEVLVTAFHELRNAKDEDGKAMEPLTTAMSTAEAISTGYAAGLHAWFYEAGPARPVHVVQHLAGTALKDSPDDLKRLRHYFNHVVKGKKGSAWKDLYAARDELP